MKANPHRETNFHFEKMIIGSSLEALVTAFKYQIPILGMPSNKPLSHYYIPAKLDLSPISCDNRLEKFTYLGGKTEKRGMPAIELWDTMFYRLSLMGLTPFWGSWSSTLEEAVPEFHKMKMLRLDYKNKSINVTFDKAIFFDIPKYVSGRKVYFVNDYIDINTVYDFPYNLFMSQDCDFLETMAYETVFYKRSGKLHGCCVKSIIAEERLDSWETSQTSIRMKTEREIFWNINKDIKITIKERETAPMLVKMCDSLEDIIHFDAMDQEVYD